MCTASDVVDSVALNMHAGNKNGVRPGKILRCDGFDILVDEFHFPMFQQKLDDEQNSLRRHKGLHADQGKSVIECPEAVAVFRKRAEDAPLAVGSKAEKCGSFFFGRCFSRHTAQLSIRQAARWPDLPKTRFLPSPLHKIRAEASRNIPLANNPYYVYWFSMTYRSLLLFFSLAVALASGNAAEPEKILNVSYDVTREFYKDYNQVFLAHWKETKGKEIKIEQSHDGSSKQARAVLDGLPADVVTENQDTDIDLLVKGGLIQAGWKEKFPNGAAPYSTTIVFLVRKGNPKQIKDWDDLVKPGVKVIIPNPKTSGNGRFSYLAAWAYASAKFKGDEAKIKEFVAALFHNVPILDTGGRAATITFIKNGQGDVLLTFENEVQQISKVFNPDLFEPVLPSLSILAEPPVAVVDKNVEAHGTREVATAYLNYLWSEEGQKVVVKHFFRPRSETLLKANPALFPAINLVTVDSLGGWAKLQKEHFADRGVFDQIFVPSSPNAVVAPEKK